MKSCSFDELSEGIRDKKNVEYEGKNHDVLMRRIEKILRDQLNLDEAKLTALKNKIKTDGKRIESID
jgi:hypothetical protein